MSGVGVAATTEVVVAGRPVLALHPGRGRVAVRLVVPEAGYEVDLTRAPSAAVACLDDAARRRGRDRSEARAALAAALEVAVATAGAWSPAPGTDPVAALGGAGHPLLGAAYDHGAAVVDRVPPWAAPLLVAPDARTAARRGFGVATRPLVRALARAVAGPGDGAAVGLGAVGLALAGAGVLQPDRLVRVLDAAGATGVAVASVDDLAAWRPVLRALGPQRAERVLVDAVDELGTLREVARLWPDVAPRLPTTLPGRLPALADRCRSLVVTDPGPRPSRTPVRGAATRRRPPVRPPTPRPSPVAVDLTVDLGTGRAARRRAPMPAAPALPAGADHGGRRAPVTGPRPDPATPVPASARLARLDGCEREGLRLARARTCGDLERWGRLLSCCVADFGVAAVAGASELLAIYRGVEARGCVELTPGGTVRQLLGPANRALDLPTRRVVLALLVDPGGIDPRSPANIGWYPRHW